MTYKQGEGIQDVDFEYDFYLFYFNAFQRQCIFISLLCFCLHCPFKFSVYFYLESRRKGGTDPELFNASIGTSVLLNNFLNADKQEVHADKI